MTTEEIDIDDVQMQIAIAQKRFATLASTEASGALVMGELSSTVMPLLDDLAKLVDRTEQGLMFVQELAEGKATPEDESQLTGEDALRITNYIEAVVDQAVTSMKDLDPDSVQAKALTLLRDEGIELIKLVNDVTLVDRTDEEPEVEGDPDDPEESANGSGDA